ncbi:MAG: 4-(cytidine 5'-diphospho)-2-C-methyl-D-erythritol kinase [Bacteroidales bacterium]|nr:4-(cytidine 5'-diphospho)-2-C-methyl-D-erythritol kinase [Bacteroidales bacterium]
MITFPNPKLNLGLHILRKRPDGYHDLESLFIPWHGLHDVLEIVPAAAPEMHLYGMDLGEGGDGGDNLCMRAWQLLHECYGIPPVAIHIWKGIPAGAGLGGGSADAAFTLRMLSDMFGLGLSDELLCSLAARLGSDCAFFIYNRPMMASGRGEVLVPYEIDVTKFRIEVTNPGIHVSTREAYAGVTPRYPVEAGYDDALPRSGISLREALSRPVSEWRDCLVNDFESSVFAAHPELARIKADFYARGACYASMSGSGSAVFGLF